jgi:hypothetical protein
LHDGAAAKEEEGACADAMAPRLAPILANLGEISSPSPNHRSPLVRSSPGDGAGVRSLCGSVTALLRKCGIDEVGREWRRADLERGEGERTRQRGARFHSILYQGNETGAVGSAMDDRRLLGLWAEQALFHSFST